MKKYIYQGYTLCFLPKFGTVIPGQVIEVDFAITNAFFHGIKDKPSPSKKTKKETVKE